MGIVLQRGPAPAPDEPVPPGEDPKGRILVGVPGHLSVHGDRDINGSGRDQVVVRLLRGPVDLGNDWSRLGSSLGVQVGLLVRAPGRTGQDQVVSRLFSKIVEQESKTLLKIRVTNRKQSARHTLTTPPTFRSPVAMPRNLLLHDRA